MSILFVLSVLRSLKILRFEGIKVTVNTVLIELVKVTVNTVRIERIKATVNTSY